ncbi:MAG TPA: helix-turn-helix domain-containing protein [Candidatus Acidoferrum sp.]|nr:helix-turn-helix domain-containing protein [Candidatus Acidoferrum sp.]
MMLNLETIGTEVAKRRKALRLRQSDVAGKAGVSRATLDALENGRLGELGFAKVSRILAAIGLEVRLGEATRRRPTLEELLEEAAHDEDLGRRP